MRVNVAWYEPDKIQSVYTAGQAKRNSCIHISEIKMPTVFDWFTAK